MPEFIKNNIPKSILPIVTVIIGFVILALSLGLTHLIMTLIEKRKGNIDDGNSNDKGQHDLEDNELKDDDKDNSTNIEIDDNLL